MGGHIACVCVFHSKCFKFFDSKTSFKFHWNSKGFPISFLEFLQIVEDIQNLNQNVFQTFSQIVVIKSFAGQEQLKISVPSVKMFDFSVSNLSTWIYSIFFVICNRQYVPTLSPASIIISDSLNWIHSPVYEGKKIKRRKIADEIFILSYRFLEKKYD